MNSFRAWLVVSVVLALSGCGRPPKTSHGDPARWSCGAAAGVCTCVPVDTSIGALGQPCAASPCCFVSRDGSCSCRLAGAARACDALMTALAGHTRVGACPP